MYNTRLKPPRHIAGEYLTKIMYKMLPQELHHSSPLAEAMITEPTFCGLISLSYVRSPFAYRLSSQASSKAEIRLAIHNRSDPGATSASYVAAGEV